MTTSKTAVNTTGQRLTVGGDDSPKSHEMAQAERQLQENAAVSESSEDPHPGIDPAAAAQDYADLVSKERAERGTDSITSKAVTGEPRPTEK